jgi:cytochrome P450
MPDTDSSVQAISMARRDGAPLDPPPEYARLRQEAPISRVSMWGGRATPWLVTRWEDARTVLASPGVSSQNTRPGFPTAIENAPAMPPGYFFGQDDPVHDTFRRALTREFMVKRIEALREPTRRILDQLLDAMIDSGGPADFVEAVALSLPSLVICELLGVPYEEHDFFQSHSKGVMNPINMTSTTGRKPAWAAPIPAPTKPSSAMGVDLTRSTPNFVERPAVAFHTPPSSSSAMSSPMRKTDGSTSSASCSARFMACTKLMFFF